MGLQELVWIITILSFVGGIVIYLFKKVVIEPLQKAIDSLNNTLTHFEQSTNKQLELIDKEVEILKLKSTRYEERLKTLFEWKGGKQ